MQPMYNFENSFKVIFPSREQWETTHEYPKDRVIAFYTDGSKKSGKVGAGIHKTE